MNLQYRLLQVAAIAWILILIHYFVGIKLKEKLPHIIFKGTTRVGTDTNNNPHTLQRCKYPNIDAFDPAAMKYHVKRNQVLCKDASQVIAENGMLKIRITNVFLIKIYYILRVTDFNSEFADPVSIYRDNTIPQGVHGTIIGNTLYYPVSQELLKVHLTDINKYEWETFHVVFLGRKGVNNQNSSFDNKTSFNNKPNIVMFMVDSLSDNNVKRMLPKTLAYLQAQPHTVIFNQHSVVGDGTTANACAFLAGKSMSELTDGKKDDYNSGEHYTNMIIMQESDIRGQ